MGIIFASFLSLLQIYSFCIISPFTKVGNGIVAKDLFKNAAYILDPVKLRAKLSPWMFPHPYSAFVSITKNAGHFKMEFYFP